MSIFDKLKLAKNSKSKIDRKVENKFEEDKTMAEKKTAAPEVEAQEPEEKTEAKKPVAKAKVKAAQPEERITGFKGFLRHPIRYTKQNKKQIGKIAAAFGIGVGTGVAGAYGAAKIGDSIASKRANKSAHRDEMEID